MDRTGRWECLREGLAETQIWKKGARKNQFFEEDDQKVWVAGSKFSLHFKISNFEDS